MSAGQKRLAIRGTPSPTGITRSRYPHRMRTGAEAEHWLRKLTARPNQREALQPEQTAAVSRSAFKPDV
jgi:hypothetical protein